MTMLKVMPDTREIKILDYPVKQWKRTYIIKLMIMNHVKF